MAIEYKIHIRFLKRELRKSNSVLTIPNVLILCNWLGLIIAFNILFIFIFNTAVYFYKKQAVLILFK